MKEKDLILKGKIGTKDGHEGIAERLPELKIGEPCLGIVREERP